MFDIHSHRDPVQTFPSFDAKTFQPGWMVGKLAAVAVSLQETDLWVDCLPDPGTLLLDCADPNRAWETGNAIFESLEKRYPDESEVVLEAPSALPSPILQALTAPESQVSDADRLASLLGRSALLIGSRDSRSRSQIRDGSVGVGLQATERSAGRDHQDVSSPRV